MRLALLDIVPVLGVCLALGTAIPAAAQSSPSALTIGTALQVRPAEGEMAFDLPLREGQGIIVDLTAITPSPVQLETMPTLRILDPAGECLRALPDYGSCPTSGIAPDVEAAAALGTVRAAIRPETAGTYRLILTLPPAEDVLSYEVLVRERPLPEPATAEPITLCRPPAGGEDGCAQERNLPASGRAYFRFEAAGETWVQIDMRGVESDGASALDSVVELLGPLTAGAPLESLPLIDSNDDYGDGLNARLRAAVPGPGTYVVLARSYAGGSGPYTLAAREFQPPAPRPMQPLALDQSVSAAFSAEEIDAFHTYELAAAAGQILTIDVQSEMDTRLSAGFEMNVFDESTTPPVDFAVLASNDDTCGTNPQLKLRFEENETVRVRLEPFGGAGAEGAYTIIARQGAQDCPPVEEATGPEPG